MKKMKFNRFKNFVILFLVFAAVYQTGMLWLGSNPSHNFFNFFTNLSASNNEGKDLPKAIVDPQKIVVGYGNKVFNVTYPGIKDADISSKTNSFIKNVMENKSSFYTEDVEFETYIDSKCVIYEFSFDVLASEYFYDIDMEIDETLGSISINSIITVPASGTSIVNKVYLIDDKQGKATVIESSNEIKNPDLILEIDNFGEENVDKLRYISTLQSGFYIFNSNVYVPQWSQKQLQYSGIAKVGVAEDDEQDILMSIENATSEFFDGYSRVNGSEDEAGVYVFSDETNVVKYYPSGIMEYYSYDRDAAKETQTLSTAYYACKEFLKKDKTLQTNLYLSKASLESDGSLVFRFNYSVNDLPVILDDEINSDFAAEVVVENNRVKKYKRYFFDYIMEMEAEVFADLDFVEAINQSTSETATSINQINNMVLGYYDSNDDLETGNLVWKIAIEDKDIIVSTEKEEEVQEQ